MKDSDILLLAGGAALLYFAWKELNVAGGVVGNAVSAATAPAANLYVALTSPSARSPDYRPADGWAWCRAC